MSFLRAAFLLYVIGAFATTIYVTLVRWQAGRSLEPHEELTTGELVVTILAWPWVVLMLLIDQ